MSLSRPMMAAMPVSPRTLEAEVESLRAKLAILEQREALRAMRDREAALAPQEEEKEPEPEDLPRVPPVFSNVEDCARLIDAAFAEGAKYVSMFGEMQVGKTGAMCAAARDFVRKLIQVSGLSFRAALKKHVFFIGMYSSVQLRSENTDKVEQWFGKHYPQYQVRSSDVNLYHRDSLTSNSRLDHELGVDLSINRLFILDEVHIASDRDSACGEYLHDIGVHDTRSLNVRVLGVTATPGPVIRDLQSLGNLHSFVHLRPGKGYVGIKELLAANFILEAKDLSRDPSAMVEMVNQIVYGNADVGGQVGWGIRDNPKHHTLRVNFAKPSEKAKAKALRLGLPAPIETCQARVNLEAALKTAGFRPEDYAIQYYDSSLDVTTKRTLNHKEFISCVESAPDVHTFTFIKGYLRCGATIPQDHMGIMYDTMVTKPDPDVLAQAQAGRRCRYELTPRNGPQPLVYTSIAAVRQWVQWVATIEKLTSELIRENPILLRTESTSRRAPVLKSGKVGGRSTHYHWEKANIPDGKRRFAELVEEQHGLENDERRTVFRHKRVKMLSFPRTLDVPHREPVVRDEDRFPELAADYSSSEDEEEQEMTSAHEAALAYLHRSFSLGAEAVSIRQATFRGIHHEYLIIHISDKVSADCSLKPSAWEAIKRQVCATNDYWSRVGFNTNPLDLNNRNKWWSESLGCVLSNQHGRKFPMMIEDVIMNGLPKNRGDNQTAKFRVGVGYDRSTQRSKLCLVVFGLKRE